MQIAVTSCGENLEAEVDPSFSACSKLLIVLTGTMSYMVVENAQSIGLLQRTGMHTAQNIAREEPDVVLTGDCGREASKFLQAAGIRVVTGVTGEIRDAVRAYLEGRSRAPTVASVEPHWA